MTKFLFKIFILYSLFFLCCVVCFGQNFAVEGDFPKQVALPDSVYKILLKRDIVKTVLEEEITGGKSVNNIKKRFFQASNINLNDDKRQDLIVKGQSFLLGANTTHFWLFERTKKGYVLVFEVATFSLTLLKNGSKGYRIIRTDRPSGSKAYTAYYRYDGKKYVYSWGKEEDI